MRGSTLYRIVSIQHQTNFLSGGKFSTPCDLLIKCSSRALSAGAAASPQPKTRPDQSGKAIAGKVSRHSSKPLVPPIEDLPNLLTKERHALYPIKNIQIRTCGDLYESWRPTSRLHRRAPAGGVECTVEYADTDPAGSTAHSENPVVLALHGSPGEHRDYTEMIVSLWTELGARVIAPNFPKFDLSHHTVFRHTAAEKAEYLKDFLRALNIPRIDCLVTHSSSLFPSLLAYEKGPQEGFPEIKSFCLLSPAGHRLIKAMKPKHGRKMLKVISLTPWLRKVFESEFGKAIFRAFKFPIHVDQMDRFWIPVITMDNAGYENVERQLKLLRRDQVPVMYAFGERDKLVDRVIFHELLEISGGQSQHMDLYGPDGKLIHTAAPTQDLTQEVRSLVFQDGGHYACFKYSNIVNAAIMEFIRGVRAAENKSGAVKNQS